MILGKIIKVVATRCHILRLKCTIFDFGWGPTPDPAGGAYSALSHPLTGFEGSYFYSEGREWGEEWKGRGRKRRKGKGEGRERVAS